MKGIDHLVLCGRDLQSMREAYARLGFRLTPPAQHPFGTCNSLIQLDRVFLELLSLGDSAKVPEHAPGQFSFAAFNRDFLARQEGFSMLVLDSDDARSDIEVYRQRGLQTYEPFDFTRQAKLPGGKDVRVGFSLAFVSSPQAPMCGFFTCAQHAPELFWQRDYQAHSNGAIAVAELAMVAENPKQMQDFLERFTGTGAIGSAEGIRLATARGAIAVYTPGHFARAYGVPPPSLAHGPRLAGCSIALQPSSLPRLAGTTVELFGTAVRFQTVQVAATRNGR